MRMGNVTDTFKCTCHFGECYQKFRDSTLICRLELMISVYGDAVGYGIGVRHTQVLTKLIFNYVHDVSIQIIKILNYYGYTETLFYLTNIVCYFLLVRLSYKTYAAEWVSPSARYNSGWNLSTLVR
jgi:hypothetical protein